MGTFQQAVYDLNTGGNQVRRWYRFHGTNVSNEPDASANAPISNGSAADLNANTNTVTPTTHVAGPHLSGETTFAWTISNSQLGRSVSPGNGDFLTSNSATTGSICFFYKSSSATNQILLGFHPTGLAFLVWIIADGTTQLQCINGADSRSQSSFPSGSGGVNLQDGNWHFVCWTCNGSTANQLYIDGVSKSYNTGTGGSGLTDHFWYGNVSPYTSGLFDIGNDQRAPASNNFPVIGSLSEYLHFGSALSASDVLALWNASQTAPLPVNGLTRRGANYRRAFAA